MRRQTYGYLPSRKASPPIGWYQIILLGDRGTCVLTTCPGLHSIAERPGFELATCWSQVQRPNHSATEPHRRHANLLLTTLHMQQYSKSRQTTITCSYYFLFLEGVVFFLQGMNKILATSTSRIINTHSSSSITESSTTSTLHTTSTTVATSTSMTINTHSSSSITESSTTSSTTHH